jgi:signal transduction histidine kinase
MGTDVEPFIQIQSEIVLGRELSNNMDQVDPNQEFAKIVVIDNGIGFEQTYAEKIFESFLRLNSKDKYEGTGLGLALCKKIVERHHGFIRAYGTPNEGATFEVYLPSA